MVFWIYLVNALLGLLILLPSYATLKSEAGPSMAFSQLLDGFDSTVYSDFMAASMKAVSPLLSVGRWLGALWLVLSVFFTGGILQQFSQAQPFELSTFLAHCTPYFGRFFRLLGVTLLFLLVSLLIPLLIGGLIGGALFESVTERELFFVGLVTGLVAVGFGTLVLCIGDYARVWLFREAGNSAFRAFGKAGRFVLSHPGKTYGPYALLMLLGTGLFGLYFLLDDLIGLQNWPTIFLMFLVQQAFIALRIFLKVWNLGTVLTVYTSLAEPRPVAALTASPAATDYAAAMGDQSNPIPPSAENPVS